MSQARSVQRTKPANAALSGLLGLLLLGMPLVLLGILFLAHGNIRGNLVARSEGIVYMALLERNLPDGEAETIASAMATTALWESADIQAFPQVFQDDPEFERWLADPENSDILTEMPPVLVLRPADPFGGAEVGAYMASIEERAGVNRAFADESGFIRLRSLYRQSDETFLAAEFATGLVALLISLFFGYAHARLFRFAGKPGLGVRVLTVGLLSCSGLLGLLGVVAVWAWLYFSSTFSLRFLAPVQIGILLIGGVVLAQIAWQLRRLLDRPNASPSTGRHIQTAVSLAPLLASGMLVFATSLSQAQDQALPSNENSRSARPALPPSETGAETSLAAGSAEERAEKAALIEETIQEKEREIDYLEEWLERSATDRQMDAANLARGETRLAQAQSALELAASALQDRREKIRFLREASGEVQAIERSRVQSDFAGNARTSLLAGALKDESIQSFYMLEQDRDSIERHRQKVRQLSLEFGRLKAFARHTQSDPEAVQGEIRKLEEQVASLKAGASILEAKPEALPTPTTAPALPPATADLGYYFFLPYGTLIHAVDEGTVLYAGEFKGLGNLVTIDHSDGYSTHYAYLAEGEIPVRVGDEVTRGQIIGTSGKITRLKNGDGFRFELRRVGKLVPIDSFKSLSEESLRRRLQGR